MPNFTDKELVSLIPKMKGWAFSLCKNATKAEDLVQSTLLRAIMHRDKFQEGTNLSSWMYTIMRNLWYGEVRKKKEIEDEEGFLTANLVAADDPYIEILAKQIVTQFRMLPKAMRTPLLLNIEGMQYNEIAEQLGLSEGTIKSRISRARDLLENGYSEEKEEEPEIEEPPSFSEIVTALWHNGLSVRQIAKQLSIPNNEVMNIVSSLPKNRHAGK